MLIEIKNRFNGKVIFSHDAENNTVKLTVKLAFKSKAYLSDAYLSGAYLSGAYLGGANLGGANLRGADLSGANLSGADLIGANLSGAYLSGAYLGGANLRGADLSGADLSGANLSGADLSGADLSGANLINADLFRTIGNMSLMFSMQLETYPITFTTDVLQIGCKKYSHQEWREFSDEAIQKMDSSALNFWKKYKDFIFMAIELRLGGDK